MSELILEVHGMGKIKKAIDAVNQEIKSDKLVRRAAVIIQRQARENASGRPGPKRQTSQLVDSILTSFPSPNEARVGTRLVPHYAPDLEFGHKQTPGRYVPAIHKRLVASFVQAYPFLGPTIEQTKSEIGDVIVTFGKDLGIQWSQP